MSGAARTAGVAPAAGAARTAGVAPAPGTASPGATPQRLAVLYDRDCGLCAATARTLRRWDRHGRLDVLALQDVPTRASPDVARLVAGRPLASALHVVDTPTGRVFSGGDGVLEIVRRLPGGSGPARAAAAIPPARWAIGLGYGLVARNRHRIGRALRLEGPTCDVPR